MEALHILVTATNAVVPIVLLILLTMVSALQLGQIREPDPERPSLILMRPGHRDLWDLAKACGSTVDAIRSANGLEAEPDENAMLLIPVT